MNREEGTIVSKRFAGAVFASWLALLCGVPLSAQEDAPTVLRQGTRGEVLPALKLPSLVPNSDFSDGLQGWQVGLGDGVEAQVEASRANDEHSQDEAVLRVRKSGGIGVVRVVSERIPVEPDTDYLLTGLYHTTTATFGTLAEFRILEIADPEQPAGKDAERAVITGPTSSSLTGHSGVYNCRPGQWRRRTRIVRTGEDTRFVRLALLVEGPPATIFFDQFHFNRREEDTRRFEWPQPEVPLSREETERRLSQRPDSQAQVRRENGGPRLYLDGRPRVPFVHLSDVFKPSRGFVRDFADAGMDLHMITLFNPSIRHWTGPGQYDLQKIDDVIWNSVRRDPEGHYLIYINVTAYPEWTQQHPDHVAMNAKGEAAVSRHDHHGPPSYYSTLYREQVMDMLRTYVRHIRAQPYARAVVGFMLGGGEDGQFYYQVVRGERTLQDGHSPGDLPLFRAWLRRRYPGVETLRAVWRDPEVDFENARPHVASERYAGPFLDLATQGHERDVLRFLNEELATLLVDGLALCKEEMGKPVVGAAYYGRAMSAMVYPMYADNSVMFRSDAVDLMGAQPGYYGWREAGNEGMLGWVFDSTRRHGKIPMLELDFRTWVSQYKDLWHDTQISRYWNRDDLLGAMARDAGKVLSVGGGAWWMEMSGGWFHEPQIMDAIRRIQGAGQAIIEEKPSWLKNDVVLVVDEGNLLNTTEQINLMVGPNYHSLAVQQRAFNRSGVSYDLVYLDDLVNEGLDGYKVYVFLNLYHANKRAREFIRTRLKRDDKLLVWQYAPGYLTEEGFSVESMRELTGIQLAVDAKSRTGLGSVFAPPQGETSEALLSGLTGRKMGLGVDIRLPRFLVRDPGAQPLGRYLDDGQVSAAFKPMEGHGSVYIGHPSGMTPLFLHNLAQFGGARPFLDAGDAAIFHRENFIVVHGVEGGGKTLRLPFPAKVTEMLSGEVLAEHSDTIPLEVKVSDTLWLHLEKADR